MTALSGKPIADRLLKHCKTFIQTQRIRALPAPMLAILQVGEDPASSIYVQRKKTLCAQVGADCHVFSLSSMGSLEALYSKIKELNQNTHYHGILVQLPLPYSSAKIQNVLGTISPEKDVDGLGPFHLGALFHKPLPTLRPCTPKGISILLQQTGYPLSGAKALILGRSALVGQPLIQELLAFDCTVTIAHSRSIEIESLFNQARIVIVAIGKPAAIDSGLFASDSIIIDVGIHPVENSGKSTWMGDIRWQASDKSRMFAYTPVPGGVGPMTVACLIENLCAAYAAQHQIPFHSLF